MASSDILQSIPVTDISNLRPATSEEIAEALSFALRFDGRKPFPQSNSLMARVTAEHLVQHLLRCGFELMKRPAAAAPTTSGHVHPSSRKPDTP
jgi:hypothetical protein